jgi:hypothetical protein
MAISIDKKFSNEIASPSNLMPMCKWAIQRQNFLVEVRREVSEQGEV